MENVLAIINKEVQELAHNIEHATQRINTELEHAKYGLEQATRLPQAMCEGKSWYNSLLVFIIQSIISAFEISSTTIKGLVDEGQVTDQTVASQLLITSALQHEKRMKQTSVKH